MLDGDHAETFHAFNELREICENGEKPILFWIGAGASRWNKYPSWEQMAIDFSEKFNRFETNFEIEEAKANIKANFFPLVFTACKNSNSKRFNNLLVETFDPKPSTPVYRRFIDSIRNIFPCFILTTNIDECLERELEAFTILQRTDFERALNIVNSDKSMICKLHGSISSISTTIMTTDDYDKLIRDEEYISTLTSLFSICNVVFLGYGLRDRYILKTINEAETNRNLFGTGPHFVLSAENELNMTGNIRHIKYLINPFTDHRSWIPVLDTIKHFSSNKLIKIKPKASETENNLLISGYYIADIYPPGKSTSSQIVEVTGSEGDRKYIHVGQGFINSEIPQTVSSSLHDVCIALICFDRLYISTGSIGRLHDLIGSEKFWILINEDILRIVHSPSFPGLIYPEKESHNGGELGDISLPMDESGLEMDMEKVIERQIVPAPGKELEGKKLLELLQSRISIIASEEDPPIANITRGILLHPVVRSLLGISDSILMTDIPKWLMYPILRLSHIVRIGLTCYRLNLAAAKIPFGGERLVNAAFSVYSSNEWAENCANYVVTDTFSGNVGDFLQNDPTIFNSIIRFRDTEEGIALRKEILDQINANEGSEFISSVNAGLKSNIPSNILDKARKKFKEIIFTNDYDSGKSPIIMSDFRTSDVAINLWKKRSKGILQSIMEKQGLSNYDPCPCGSGDQVKFCCMKPLNN